MFSDGCTSGEVGSIFFFGCCVTVGIGFCWFLAHVFKEHNAAKQRKGQPVPVRSEDAVH